jgi:hypothetical protein
MVMVMMVVVPVSMMSPVLFVNFDRRDRPIRGRLRFQRRQENAQRERCQNQNQDFLHEMRLLLSSQPNVNLNLTFHRF